MVRLWGTHLGIIGRQEDGGHAGLPNYHRIVRAAGHTGGNHIHR